MYVFNINLEGKKVSVPCKAYTVLQEKPWNGYLQLAGIEGMRDDVMPDHKITSLYVPQSTTNWFAKLEKIQEKEVEELELEESEEEVVPQQPIKQNKRRRKK